LANNVMWHSVGNRICNLNARRPQLTAASSGQAKANEESICGYALGPQRFGGTITNRSSSKHTCNINSSLTRQKSQNLKKELKQQKQQLRQQQQQRQHQNCHWWCTPTTAPAAATASAYCYRWQQFVNAGAAEAHYAAAHVNSSAAGTKVRGAYNSSATTATVVTSAAA